MAGYRPMYTVDEDNLILDYIVKGKFYYELKGRAFWMDLANTGYWDRTWQSLKEHFHKSILPNINDPKYNIPPEEKKYIQLALKQQDKQWWESCGGDGDNENSDDDSDTDISHHEDDGDSTNHNKINNGSN